MLNDYNNDMGKYLTVLFSMMGKNENFAMYVATPVVYDFKIQNGMPELKSLENMFDFNFSPQEICIKVVHRLAMMNAYWISYSAQNHLGVNQNKLDPYQKYSLLLAIGNEDINVVNYKGFGLFCSHVKDFGQALYEAYETLLEYIKELSNKKEYDFLKRITNCWNELRNDNPDTALVGFIGKNKDFYCKEIKQAEIEVTKYE